MNSEQNIQYRKQLEHQANKDLDRIFSAQTLWMGCSVALCGTSAAAINGSANVLIAILCLLFCVLAQMCGNATHVYEEARTNSGHFNADTNNTNPIIYQKFAIVSGIMAATIGLTMMAIAGWWLIIFGLATAICVYFVYMSPSPLVHSPWATVFTFLLFGPIGVIGTCFAQIPYALEEFDSPVYLNASINAALLMGLMAASSHLQYLYQNWRIDMLNNNNVLSTRIGPRRTRIVYLIIGLLASAQMYAMAFTDYVTHIYTFIGFISMATVYLASRIYFFIVMRKGTRCIFGNIRHICDVMIFLVTLFLLIFSMLEAYT